MKYLFIILFLFSSAYGQVGIGTNTPDSMLNVVGGINFSTIFLSNDPSDSILVIKSNGGVGKRPILPYKVYTATLSQNGTNDPTVNILFNTLGNIIWSRTAMGVYVGVLDNSFITNKTFILFSNDAFLRFASPRRLDINSISLSTYTLNFAEESILIAADDVLDYFQIEIRVYN